MHPKHVMPLVWRTSNSCTGGAACVEVAALPDGGAAIRRSGDPEGAELRFPAEAWAEFIAASRAGEFDPVRSNEDARTGDYRSEV